MFRVRREGQGDVEGVGVGLEIAIAGDARTVPTQKDNLRVYVGEQSAKFQSEKSTTTCRDKTCRTRQANHVLHGSPGVQLQIRHGAVPPERHHRGMRWVQESVTKRIVTMRFRTMIFLGRPEGFGRLAQSRVTKSTRMYLPRVITHTQRLCTPSRVITHTHAPTHDGHV